MEVAARRREWRAVSQDQDQEHAKLAQSDERTIYEEGARPLEFCSVTVEGLSDDLLQQRLQEIGRQREELLRIEVELRAQAIARSEILEMQRRYEARIEEHAVLASKLKEQLQEREHHILEMEMKLEEKDRELRAMQIDHEAAWAKEHLLREQNKELATFRREFDNSEAERAQHLKKIHDLQQHIQEKEAQFLALDEQHRLAQENIIFKDEQLREAQAWMLRAQEVDALHSTTNQSLQAELQERTEQFNQYWIALQRQFADIEQHHLQSIQQLQLELAEARERTGTYRDGSQIVGENSTKSPFVQNKATNINANDAGAANEILGSISNGTSDKAISLAPASNTSTQMGHISGVPLVPSTVLGMGAFIPAGQMAALHPFVIHPQSVPHMVQPNNEPHLHSHLGFQQVSNAPVQHLHYTQAAPDVSQVHDHNSYPPPQQEQSFMDTEAKCGHQSSDKMQSFHMDNLITSINLHERPGPIVNGSSEGAQAVESNVSQGQVPQKPHEIASIDLQFVSQSYGPSKDSKQNNDVKVQNESTPAVNSQPQENIFVSEQQREASTLASSAAEMQQLSYNDVTECNDDKRTANSLIPGKAVKSPLLDERSLLACIVRAIPAGSDGQIRISTTLPNRLGKMLAPLHWHDYKKQYGKLDDFVGRHPELFVIEGDFIHLREGAQGIISATAAYAKVAAAAASSASYSSLLPSVAVTPIAPNNRHKKVPLADTISSDTALSRESAPMANPVDSCNTCSVNSKVKNKQSNGVSFNIVQGLADVKVSTRYKELQEINGLSVEARSGRASVNMNAENKGNPDKATLPPSHGKGSSNGRHLFGGEHQGRTSSVGMISRRRN